MRIGGREIDRDLPIPDVERALGDRAAHGESAGHVHQRMHARRLGRVARDRRDDATSAAFVRSHAIGAGAIASFGELRGARLDLLGGSIDQDE